MEIIHPVQCGQGLRIPQVCYINRFSCSACYFAIYRFMVCCGISMMFSVKDWNAYEQIWDHCLKTLRVVPEEHPMMVAEPAFSQSADRRKIAELLFEKIKVSGGNVVLFLNILDLAAEDFFRIPMHRPQPCT